MQIMVITRIYADIADKDISVLSLVLMHYYKCCQLIYTSNNNNLLHHMIWIKCHKVIINYCHDKILIILHNDKINSLVS